MKFEKWWGSKNLKERNQVMGRLYAGVGIMLTPVAIKTNSIDIAKLSLAFLVVSLPMVIVDIALSKKEGKDEIRRYG